MLPPLHNPLVLHLIPGLMALENIYGYSKPANRSCYIAKPLIITNIITYYKLTGVRGSHCTSSNTEGRKDYLMYIR